MSHERGDDIKLYLIVFKGRKLGSIGIFYDNTVTVEAEDEGTAIMGLCKTYDLYMWPEARNVIELSYDLSTK